MNNAVAVLNAAYAPGNVQYPGDSTLLPPPRTATFSTGSVTWGGALQPVTGKAWWWQWAAHLHAPAVANPTGPDGRPRSDEQDDRGRPGRAAADAADPARRTSCNWIFALHDAIFSPTSSRSPRRSTSAAT